MKKLIVALLVVSLIAGGLILLFSKEGKVSVSKEKAVAEIKTEKAVAIYTDQGFSPARVTIKKDDTVVFENKSTQEMWVASDIHPTHTLYPGSGIQKCGQVLDGIIFDACKAIGPGASFEFTFKEPGTWSYHNHLRATQKGTIVVQ